MTKREVVVHLDAAHRGLGTMSCGPDTLDKYRLLARSYDFSYRTLPEPRPRGEAVEIPEIATCLG